ncbi:uncharacterized protein LOC106866148 isoform X2 [Brachypodium distachyon]|uniref:uncharacterized protein LOC106866148 isoform X2 n=1 Tax=Brachypodium distachyon TaxID=15368 RepID=UPI000D0DE674|nr:uncharacterized protein LOC106866148 isoform X2 [Brachypodium distachyon]|eukprot:XP_024314255.1 uncharacterized protein LOC106866148 isoform X2 [Brachypodium distachyon]
MLEVFTDVVAVRGEPAPQPLPLPPQQKKGKPRGVRAGGDGDGGGGDDDDDDDDDCVVLDGDPDRPVAVAGRFPTGGCGSGELEIVAEKGQIACRDFPHSRHLCSQFSFNTTPHVKHCSMCYCFVCDAPAPCRYWGNGLTIDDHCHATDKETKWKTLRQAFKCKSLTASHPEKQQNVVYPTMLSPRQQECDEEYTSEDEEYYGPAAEGTLYVGNLRHHIDDEYLAQLFENVGIVEFSEILYDRETGQSRGYGYVTMSTVEEAEMAVNTFHRRVSIFGAVWQAYDCGNAISPST